MKSNEVSMMFFSASALGNDPQHVDQMKDFILNECRDYSGLFKDTINEMATLVKKAEPSEPGYWIRRLRVLVYDEKTRQDEDAYRWAQRAFRGGLRV